MRRIFYTGLLALCSGAFLVTPAHASVSKTPIDFSVESVTYEEQLQGNISVIYLYRLYVTFDIAYQTEGGLCKVTISDSDAVILHSFSIEYNPYELGQDIVFVNTLYEDTLYLDSSCETGEGVSASFTYSFVSGQTNTRLSSAFSVQQTSKHLVASNTIVSFIKVSSPVYKKCYVITEDNEIKRITLEWSTYTHQFQSSFVSIVDSDKDGVYSTRVGCGFSTYPITNSVKVIPVSVV